MNAPVIETDRLILRPHNIKDFDAMAKMWAEPRVAQFIGGVPSTRAESWSRLIRYIGFWPALGFGYFAIIDKSTGAFLGEAGLADFHREIEPSLDSYAEAGWAMQPHSWGKGFAQEALGAVLDWYASTTDPRPVTCIIDPDNSASIRLAEKVGFRVKTKTEYMGAPCLMYER
ncbi:MAG: GNAT family N-acetyltransferase [Rhizobiaceae bacterium]